IMSPSKKSLSNRPRAASPRAWIQCLCLAVCSLSSGRVQAQTPRVEWAVKVDHTGRLLWIKRAGGNSVVVGRGIGVDAAGNAYVAGYFHNGTTAVFGSITLTSSIEEMFLVKFDSNGNVVWAIQANGDGDDGPLGLAVDGAGNSYVTGVFAGTTD